MKLKRIKKKNLEQQPKHKVIYISLRIAQTSPMVMGDIANDQHTFPSQSLDAASEFSIQYPRQPPQTNPIYVEVNSL